MLVVTAFYNGDASQAASLFEWCAELDGMQSHPCLLVASKGMDDDRVQAVRVAAQKAFNEVSIIRPLYPNEKGWPESPNHLFATACAYIAKNAKQSFFWLEPDCDPLSSGWLKAIETEYINCGKPYMGFNRPIPVPHITGVAVYPAQVARYNPDCLKPHRNKFGAVPFDLVCPEKTLRNAHETKLIQHDWGTRESPPTFRTLDDLKRLNPEAVLFHRTKDDGLISLLRESRSKPSLIRRAFDSVKAAIPKITVSSQPIQVSRNKLSIAIAYLYPCDARETFVPFAKRWAEAYKKFRPEITHDVIVSMSNGSPNEADFAVFDGIPAIFNVGYNGGGWDIGNFQHIAKICNHDLVVFMNSRAFLSRKGWLEPFIQAFEKFGPNGLYGASASYEACPIVGTFPEPNPHIRTGCFITNPKALRQYPHVINSREESFKFESGEWNISEWYAQQGWPVKLVTADGFYDRHEWRKPPNIFRRGDQSNCLVSDRHTLLYSTASKQEKLVWAAAADAHGATVPARTSPQSRPIHGGSKTITIVAATSLNARGHAKAIDWTASLIPHPCERLLIASEIVPNFSGKQLPLPEPWAKNGKWTVDDMCDFLLTGLHKYIATDLAIIVHDDGYALNKSKWTDEFLEYDYIGAPWPSKFPWTKSGGRVGNGGFSLRSKRWLQHASTLLKLPPGTSEDVYCGATHLRHFLKAGYKIAPVGIAMRWSFEHVIEENPNWTLKDSFGWHGRTTNDPVRKYFRLK